MNGLKRLILEVHRRSLWQVLLIYVGGAWACYELIDTITNRFGLPAWLPALAAVLFLLGLPFVVATAFVREVPAPAVAPPEAEPHIVEAEAAAARHEARRRHRFLTGRSAGLSFLVALAVWGVVLTGWLVLGGGEAAAERKSIAVLPLANRSANPEDQYFTDGIHDAIIEHLAKIADLRVISRTSVMEYRNTTKNIRQVAEELGVATVLEGGVQRAGGQIKVATQLIAARTDEHLWAESYERELTAENVFAIQSDVAQQIAGALRARLAPAERERIEEQPTENLEAYEHYLRGNDYYLRRVVREDAEAAAQMYRRAIDLDPNFALAYAALARALAWLSFHFGEPDALRRAKQAMDRALELDPDLPETHLALGDYYYEGYRDYEEALEHYKHVQAEVPGHAHAIAMIGAILRRQGRWEEAAANMERALDLDPRHHIWIYSLAQTYLRMRRFAEAERYLDRGIALTPQHPEAYQEKAILYLSWRADKNQALQALQLGARRADLAQLLLSSFWRIGFLCRIFPQELSDLLDELPIHALTSAIDSGSYYLFKAETRAASGETTRAFAFNDSARVALEEWIQTYPNARLSQHPAEQHILLGLAYAGSDRPAEAVREGERAVRALHPSEDALVGPYGLVALAWILVRVGEHDMALDQLSHLLSEPSILSARLVRLDPIWDPLRDHPRFQALLEELE